MSAATTGSEVTGSDRASSDRVGYDSEVVIRWSDMDVFQHVNHARMVTLLEEARIPWLFGDGVPTEGLRDGAVIADLHVRYRGQIRHDETPVTVTMWIEKVRAVDFTVGYEVRGCGSAPDAPAAVTASTQIAAFDIDTQRLRRLTADEKEYLNRWRRD